MMLLPKILMQSSATFDWCLVTVVRLDLDVKTEFEVVDDVKCLPMLFVGRFNVHFQ